MCVRLTVGLCKRSGRSGDSGAGCANAVTTDAQSTRVNDKSVRLIFVFLFKACVGAGASCQRPGCVCTKTPGRRFRSRSVAAQGIGRRPVEPRRVLVRAGRVMIGNAAANRQARRRLRRPDESKTALPYGRPSRRRLICGRPSTTVSGGSILLPRTVVPFKLSIVLAALALRGTARSDH